MANSLAQLQITKDAVLKDVFRLCRPLFQNGTSVSSSVPVWDKKYGLKEEASIVGVRADQSDRTDDAQENHGPA
jgi:hypothetical protein